MLGIIDYLNRQSKLIIILLVIMLVGMVSLFDYLSGPEISTSIFYLLPIIITTLFASGISGIVFSVICAAIWLVNDISDRSVYSSGFIPYWNMTVRLGIFLIVTYILYLLKKESNLSRRDYLTGVSNRRSFEELGAKILKQHPFTIAYIDLDNFKDINDRYSHHTGNVLLRAVADAISDNVRDMDIVARLGGDEFSVLLPKTGHEESRVIIQRVKDGVLEAMKKNNWPMTLSIGAVTFTAIPNNIIDAIRKADHLMYAVKNNGKNMIKYETVGEKGN